MPVRLPPAPATTAAPVRPRRPLTPAGPHAAAAVTAGRVALWTMVFVIGLAPVTSATGRSTTSPRRTPRR